MEFVGNIELGQPHLLVYMSVAVVAVLAIAAFWIKRRQKILRFLGGSSGRIYGRLRISCYLVLLLLYACGLMLILCEPYSKTVTAHEIYEATDIVFAVDISKSMLALSDGEDAAAVSSDCAPTRLNEVAGQVLNFISRLEQSQNEQSVRLALVVFARHAYPVIPLFTKDFQLFKRRFQQELRVKNIIHALEGSNHWYALERSLEVFQGDASGRKLLILLTDGEPDVPQEALLQNKIRALRALRKAGEVDIHVIGIGQPNVRKPVYAVWSGNGCPDTRQGFLRQAEGEGQGDIMWSIPDLAGLSDFAAETGGQYIHSSTGAELAESLQRIITQKRRAIGVDHETRRYDLSKPIIIGLLVLQAGMILLKTP
jgi:hypothetical protein